MKTLFYFLTTLLFILPLQSLSAIALACQGLENYGDGDSQPSKEKYKYPDKPFPDDQQSPIGVACEAMRKDYIDQVQSCLGDDPSNPKAPPKKPRTPDERFLCGMRRDACKACASLNPNPCNEGACFPEWGPSLNACICAAKNPSDYDDLKDLIRKVIKNHARMIPGNDGLPEGECEKMKKKLQNLCPRERD